MTHVIYEWILWQNILTRRHMSHLIHSLFYSEKTAHHDNTLNLTSKLCHKILDSLWQRNQLRGEYSTITWKAYKTTTWEKSGIVLGLSFDMKGHNLKCDNTLCSCTLQQVLLKRNITMVGTMKRKKLNCFKLKTRKFIHRHLRSQITLCLSHTYPN